MSQEDTDGAREHLHADASQYERDHLVDFDFVDTSGDVDEVRMKGRLVPGNSFLLNLRPGEQPHVHVRSVRPFEALFRADGRPDPDEEDVTPRVVTSMSPGKNRLSIYSIAALVMADTDGFTAGEVVWLSRAVSTVLDRTDRVLVSRGDDSPLLPITSKLLSLI